NDGELSYEYFLKRISEIASLKGLIDIKGYDKESSRIVESVLGKVNTEASKTPLDAFNGAYGEISIRNGTRKVFVSLLSAVMFFLDPIKVEETTPLYDLVRGSSSLEEANKRLNEFGIYTEYNFEIDLYKKFGVHVSSASKDDINKIREEGRRRLWRIIIKC
ncbi:MAG: DUF1152 domain-containing protein, partial [Saccharolobus sp.]